MIAPLEKYKLHIEMLPFFHELDYDRAPVRTQNRKLLETLERNTSRSIASANEAVVAHAAKMVKWLDEHRKTLSCIQRPPLPDEPPFIAEHVRALKKMILNPNIPVAELRDPAGAFQKTLAELKSFAYAKPFAIPAETTRKQVDEIQSFYDGFQLLTAEFSRLIEVRNLTVDMGDYTLGLLEEKVRKDDVRGRKYWQDRKIQWIRELHDCEKAYFDALKSLPLEISAGEEERIFSVIGDRGSAYYKDGNEEQKEMQSYFAKRSGDLAEFPIAGVEAVYAPKGAPPQKFRFPVSVSRREIVYLSADFEQQEESVRAVFDTLLAQFLRGTNAGEMEISIVDPVYSGGFVTKFQTNLAPDQEKKKDKPAASIELSIATRDSNDLKSFLRHYQERNIARTILTLGDQYQFVEDFNRKNPSLPIPRKFLLINGLDRFFNISGMNAAADLQNLTDILKEAARCGIFVVLAGSAGFLDFLKEKSTPAVVKAMRCISFVPERKDELLISDMDSAIQFEHPDFKLTSSLQLLRTSQEEAERLCIGLREIQRNVDLSIPLADILAETGGLFSSPARRYLKVPFGKNTRGEVTTWFCDKEVAGHTLIVGGTGSGKSNLLHCLITSACYLHRPEEFQIFLIDLKKGVEFKRYADYKLPHARVVAINGDAEMALGVLESVYKLYEHNSELMKHYDAESLEALWVNGGKAPRIALVIDEFQILFENDNTKQKAASCLEKLIREGRAAGFCVILATQNLSNVPSSIKGNDLTRIVMKNNRDIFVDFADFANRELFDQVTRAGDFLLLEGSSKQVLGRAALIKREYQNQLLSEIASASDAKLKFETLIYDGTVFPDGNNRLFQRRLAEAAEKEKPTFVLGEDRSLSDCIRCVLDENPGENILVAGDHSGPQDQSTPFDWEDDTLADKVNTNAVSCRAAVYWTLSRSLNSLSARGGFRLSIFDRKNFLLPYLDSSAGCKELGNVREVANEIFELFDLAQECEKNGTVAPERRMLAILDAQTLLQLRSIKNPAVQAEAAARAKAEAEARARAEAAARSGAKQSPGSMLADVSAPAQVRRSTVDYASGALGYLLQNGPQFHINILMGTNNAGILAREVLERGSSLKSLFHHIICMQMSEEDLSGNLGIRSLRLTDMGPRYAFYANEIVSARPQRFRPYYDKN